jgi:SnoaL-like domain
MLCRRDVAAAIAFLVSRAALAAANPATDGPGDPPTTNSKSGKVSEISNANELVVRYLAAWNEHDAERRYDMIKKTWADDGIYVDAHRHGDGAASIDAMIADAQHQFPGYRLRLVSKIEAHNGRICFSWAAGGTEQAPLYLAGTDFVIVAGDGRIQSVTGFVDAAPAPVT